MSTSDNSMDKQLLSIGVLLHCRTVVEKSNFVSTGVMTHVEGELFEVELPEYNLFELGEAVKLTVYSPVGIQSIPSIVFAKYEGAIALIQPPKINKKFDEKREHPRVKVDGQVQILQILSDKGESSTLKEPIMAAISNISLTGIAFEAPDLPEFRKEARLKGYVEVGFGFECEIDINRSDREEDKYVFGGRMNILQPEMLRPLRALILKSQVERHIEQRAKAKEEKKRSF
jgi:hypothetical protein